MNAKLSVVVVAAVLACSSWAPAEGAVADDVRAEVMATPALEPHVAAFVADALLRESANPIFVAYVQRQNADRTSIVEIRAIDNNWINAEEELPIQREKLSNAVAQELRRLAATHPAIVEAFVMDNQGAIVGSNALTSDYWQADEAKWQKSYRAGRGGVDVGKAKFDRSANAVLQQVSLPIIGPGDTVIGAITYGLVGARVSASSAAAPRATAASAHSARVAALVSSAGGCSAQTKAFILAALVPESSNAIFSSAARDQNLRGASLSEIKSIDRSWMAAEDELPIQAQLLNNEVARELKRIAANNPGIVEAFVMDNQGALVGASSLTSDYWQGDEAKWSNSFNAGQGGIDVGSPKFDRSANAVLQQISLPVLAGDGAVVGAVTYGLNVAGLVVRSPVATPVHAAAPSGRRQANGIVQRLRTHVDLSTSASASTKSFTKSVLLAQCTNPAFVSAVETQNARGQSIDRIVAIDKQWINAEDELPIQRQMLGNAVAQELRRLAATHRNIIEAFVMDDKGALVGASALTSDYWQGDEAKWQKSYENGTGGVHIGRIKFDRSANAMLQQISLPVVSDGRVVGAMTFGIAVED